MQTDEQKELWKRIRNFSIDDPSASVKYSDKLAFHNHWSGEYTARVIEEYKRFIFLCCVVPGGASPSPAVDEAWHLHLTYTYNYWKEFCPNVLRLEIHHFPSKGGADEKEKHSKWYENTLRSYREIFNEDPPEDIWQVSVSATNNNNSNESGQIPHSLGWYKKSLYLLAFPFIFNIVLFRKISPYSLTGRQFLFFYITLMIAVIVLFLIAANRKKKYITSLLEENYDSGTNVYQLSRFVFGKEKSIRAAIIDLTGKNILEPERRGRFTFYPSRINYGEKESNPILSGLMKNYREGEKISYTDVSYYYSEETTYNAGLATIYKLLPRKDTSAIILSVLIVLIGIARVFQGVGNEKPVLFLVFLLIAFSFASFVLISVCSGAAVVGQIFTGTFNKGQLDKQLGDTSLANMFVFAGLSSISGITGFSYLHDTFSNYRNRKDLNSSACGSSGCGSSGCGSSGCGGGCGGCGGGD